MVIQRDIADMWTHLRETNSNISDEALDFINLYT